MHEHRSCLRRHHHDLLVHVGICVEIHTNRMDPTPSTSSQYLIMLHNRILRFRHFCAQHKKIRIVWVVVPSHCALTLRPGQIQEIQ